jgi:hypothetical protein
MGKGQLYIKGETIQKHRIHKMENTYTKQKTNIEEYNKT